MLGVYFSGTGNTRHCIRKFLNEVDSSAACVSIEDERVRSLIAESDSIILAYPIYFSNLPKIVRDFIEEAGAGFAGKKIFLIATMGLFSGDAARKFKNGMPTQEGIGVLYHMAGLFGQRLWFYNKTKEYSNKLNIICNTLKKSGT